MRTIGMIEEEEKLLPGQTLEREQKQSFTAGRKVRSVLLAVYVVTLHAALLVSLLGHISISTAPMTRCMFLEEECKDIAERWQCKHFDRK